MNLNPNQPNSSRTNDGNNNINNFNSISNNTSSLHFLSSEEENISKDEIKHKESFSIKTQSLLHQTFFKQPKSKNNRRRRISKMIGDFRCSHRKCEQKFRTIKQKIHHHDQFEEECHYDKKHIMTLLYQFMTVIDKLTMSHKNILQMVEYSNVVKQFDKARCTFINKDQFNAFYITKGK